MRSVSPAITVGRANGRSTSDPSSFLPGNESRTSTHAIAVPANVFTITTITALSSVSLSAAQDSGLRTADQNAPHPPVNAWDARAAIGMSTSRLR